MSIKQKNNDTSSLVKQEKKYISDSNTITNNFNNFSTSIAETVKSKLKFSNKSFRRFLLTDNNNSFVITATNKEKIYKITSFSILMNLLGLLAFQLKFYTLFKIKYLITLQLLCNLSFLQLYFPLF